MGDGGLAWQVISCQTIGDMMPSLSPSPTQSIGYGLKALVEELASQSIEERQLLKASGLRSLAGSLTQAQLFAVMKGAQAIARDPLTALKAGTRQRIHHFGVYGFALATSPTFGETFTFFREHAALAGAVLRITYRREGRRGIILSHNPQSLGRTLPFVAEFWRSSMTALAREILGVPFPSLLMRFPYPRPRQAQAYRETFGCPVEFDSDAMEWHFEASVLERPCPSASSLTAHVCQEFCERVIVSDTDGSALQREIRGLVLAHSRRRVTADEAAASLGLSKRTLLRRLGAEKTSFQQLIDQTRAAIACEYLENTELPVSEISERCGYGDEANFRKAFTRWRGRTPAAWRMGRRSPRAAAILA